MSKFDLIRLQGGRLDIRFPADDDSEIVVWCHPPTSEELAIALGAAGAEIGPDGQLKFPEQDRVVSLSRRVIQIYLELAAMCVETVENLDDWPQQAREVGPDGLERLTASAWDMLPHVVRLKIGETVWNHARVSREEGKA